MQENDTAKLTPTTIRLHLLIELSDWHYMHYLADIIRYL